MYGTKIIEQTEKLIHIILQTIANDRCLVFKWCVTYISSAPDTEMWYCWYIGSTRDYAYYICTLV